MMDVETYEQFVSLRRGPPYVSSVELVLSDAEGKLFKMLHTEGRLLEQE